MSRTRSIIVKGVLVLIAVGLVVGGVVKCVEDDKRSVAERQQTKEQARVELTEAIEEAEGLDMSLYRSQSSQFFGGDIKKAREALDDKKATLKSLEDATRDLKDAIDDLVPRDLSVPEEYEDAISTADQELQISDIYSKQGLYDELISRKHQYSQAAAQYAVDHVDADWVQNAINFAKRAWNDDVENLTREEIYDVLVKDAKFTPEQAQVAVETLPKYKR